MLRSWKTEGGAHTLVDVWQILYRDARIVSLFGNVVSSNMLAGVSAQSLPCVAEDVMGSLMLLAQESNEPIKIVINNVGGEVNAGFAIIQAIEHVKSKGIEVWTINICSSASMATVILTTGTKGKRFVQNNTMTHLHSGSKVMSGKAEDVEAVYEFFRRHFTKTIYKILLENTKLPEFWNKKSDSKYNPKQISDPAIRSKLLKDFLGGERYLEASEAVEAGVADKVLMPGDPIIDDIYRVIKRAEKGKKSV